MPRWLAVGLVVLVVMPACGRTSGKSANGGSSTGDSLLARGDSLYVRGHWDSAQTALSAAVAGARARRDERSEALALTSLALAEWQLGDLSAAWASAESSLALKERLGLSVVLSRSYNTLGLIAADQGRNTDAEALFRRALESGQAVHDTLAIAKAYGGLANVATYRGDIPHALIGHRLERLTAHAVGDVKDEGNGLAGEAMDDIWEGDPQPALARLDTARALYRTIAYNKGQQNALSQLATALELMGEDDRAFAALDTALAIARHLGLPSQEAEDLRLLGELHVRLGDYRRAVGYFADAEKRMRAAGFEDDRASALRGLGEAYLRLGNVPEARGSAEEALRLHTVADEPVDELDDLLLLVEIDYRQGGLPQAEARLRAGRVVANRVNTRESRIAIAMAEARLADQAHDARRVLRVVRGVQSAIVSGDVGAEWEAGALAARAYARLGALDSAAAVGRRAVAAVERLRGALASEALRATYVADRADVYSDLVVTLLRLGRTEEAFVVADAARSRDLLTQLGAARGEVERGVIPPPLAEGEELLRRIDALVQRLRATEGGHQRERGAAADSGDAGLAAQLAAARGEYEALLIRSAQERPRATTLLGGEPARLDEVRAALGSDEVLVDYLLTSDRLFAFAVTRGGLRVVQSPLQPRTLTQRVRLLRDVWGSPTPDWRWGLEAARGLYQSLVAPLRNAGLLRGVRHFVVVPHGILGQVPFAALVDDKTGRYLVQDFALTELPSAGALAALRRPRESKAGQEDVGVGFAPFPDELPATRQEIAAFHASLPRSTTRVGDQATEGEVRLALAGTGVVHVATHGVLDVRTPMFSYIELARRAAAGEGPDDDGRLELHELLGLQIRSPLVFLSGCETGAGQEWTEDPVTGAAEVTFAQGILSAGATNVVLTLWRIDDAGAATFAGRFYQSIAGVPLDEALAGAQRAMARDSAFASPYYWAGYVLSGAGRLGPSMQDTRSASVPNGWGEAFLSSKVRGSMP